MYYKLSLAIAERNVMSKRIQKAVHIVVYAVVAIYAQCMSVYAFQADQSFSGDFDGNGRCDIAIFHPACSCEWELFYNNSMDIDVVTHGAASFTPITGDYDGDGIADIGIYDPPVGGWNIRLSGGGTKADNWGWSDSIPVPEDYDGDGLDDIGVFYPPNGEWIIKLSSGGTTVPKIAQ